MTEPLRRAASWCILAAFGSLTACTPDPIYSRVPVSAADLRREYLSWCEENGERPLTPRDLGPRLTGKGFERKRYGHGNRWHWFGLALVTPEQANEPGANPSDALPDADSPVVAANPSAAANVSGTGSGTGREPVNSTSDVAPSLASPHGDASTSGFAGFAELGARFSDLRDRTGE